MKNEELEPLAQVQIIASETTWNKISTYHVPWWMRPLFAITGIFLLLALLPMLIAQWLVSLFNIMTCGWIRSVHRLSKKMRRVNQWLFVIAHSAIVCMFSPQLAGVIVMGYCYARSHDVPHNWLDWFLKLGQRKKPRF